MLIYEYVQKDILKVTPVSQKAVEDFGLAAKVETVLGKEGHDVSVSAIEGLVAQTMCEAYQRVRERRSDVSDKKD